MKTLKIFSLILILFLTSCSSQTNSQEPQFATDESQALQQEDENNDASVDIDLTQMNSTMVYSQVYDMMVNATSYVDKVIKMEGYYYQQTDTETDITYNLIVIIDATGCCPQGIEFVAVNGAQYPQVTEQYPQTTQPVQITGVFEMYEEQGLTYFRILSDDIVVLDA